jgi:hypothetical protein
MRSVALQFVPASRANFFSTSVQIRPKLLTSVRALSITGAVRIAARCPDGIDLLESLRALGDWTAHWGTDDGDSRLDARCPG